jgi:hypothetical protein
MAALVLGQMMLFGCKSDKSNISPSEPFTAGFIFQLRSPSGENLVGTETYKIHPDSISIEDEFGNNWDTHLHVLHPSIINAPDIAPEVGYFIQFLDKNGDVVFPYKLNGENTFYLKIRENNNIDRDTIVNDYPNESFTFNGVSVPNNYSGNYGTIGLQFVKKWR